LMFLGSAKSIFRTSTRVLWTLFAATFLLKLGATVAYYALHLDGLSFTELVPTMQGEHMEVLWWQTLLLYCPIFRVSEFLLGIVLAKMFMAQRDAEGVGGAPSMVASIPAIFVLAFYVAAAIVAGVYLPHLALGVVLIPVQALVIYRLAFPVSSWTGLLSAPMILLGEASYALYMFHDAVAKWVDAPLKLDVSSGAGVHSKQLLIHLGCAIVAVVLSVVIYKLIEVPSRREVRDRLGKYLLTPRQPREAPILTAPMASMSEGAA
jgi:peptidoglycan/LPS O-acetylase OafA/YrhL